MCSARTKGKPGVADGQLRIQLEISDKSKCHVNVLQLKTVNRVSLGQIDKQFLVFMNPKLCFGVTACWWSYVTLLLAGGSTNQFQSITGLLGARYANRSERDIKNQYNMERMMFQVNNFKHRIFVIVVYLKNAIFY